MNSTVRQVPIGSVVEDIKNWHPLSIKPNDYIEYIDIGCIDQQRKIVRSANRIKASEAPSRARQKVRKNDVLVSTVRPNLNAVALVQSDFDNCIVSTGFTVLRPIENILSSRYLYYWVRSPYFLQQVVCHATGASYPAITDSIVKESRIPIHPIYEQKRIAAILDKADAIRYKQQELIKLTDEFLRSVFLDIFGDPVINSKGWLIDNLGKHLNFITSGSRGWAGYYSSNGSRFIRSYDVQMNHISDTDTVFVRPPFSAENQRTKIITNDVLLTITGSRIGRVAPVLDGFQDAYVSQHVAILRLDGSLLPHYVSMFLSDPRGCQHQIKKLQYGQTKPGLNLDQIRNIKISCPPKDLQNRFRIIWEFNTKILQQQKWQRQRCDDFFRSLVQRAFRGEL